MLAGALGHPLAPSRAVSGHAPPQITLRVTYSGASAESVQNTVVQVIEKQLSGLDHLRYFSSASNKDGSMEIVLTLEQGSNASGSSCPHE